MENRTRKSFESIEDIDCPGKEFNDLVMFLSVDGFYERLPTRYCSRETVRRIYQEKRMEVTEETVDRTSKASERLYRLRQKILQLGGRKKAVERVSAHLEDCYECYQKYEQMDAKGGENFDREHLNFFQGFRRD